MVRPVAIDPEGAVHHWQSIPHYFDSAKFFRDRVDVFPNEFACGGDFEKVTFGVGANQGVAVGQTLCTAADLAEEAVVV